MPSPASRAALAALALVLTLAPVFALEPITLYDDFAKRLDADLWFGQEGPSTGTGMGTNAVRKVENGKLSLTYAAYGTTGTDDGFTPSRFALRFRDGLSVTAVQATVNVSTVLAGSCPTNFYPTFSRVRLGGDFFNVSSPLAESQLNDVQATIAVERTSDSPDPEGVLRIYALVLQCLADDCAAGNQLLGFADLGTVSAGEDVTLSLQWDPDLDQFIAQRGTDAPIFLPYFVSDTAPPGKTTKGIEIDPVVASCTSRPRPTGAMAVLVDDVHVNESAAGK